MQRKGCGQGPGRLQDNKHFPKQLRAVQRLHLLILHPLVRLTPVDETDARKPRSVARSGPTPPMAATHCMQKPPKPRCAGFPGPTHAHATRSHTVLPFVVRFFGYA